MADPTSTTYVEEEWLPPSDSRPVRAYRLPELRTYPAELNTTEELLDRNVEAGSGDRPAVISGERVITYRELLADVMRFGRALRRLGVGSRDRVLLHSLTEVPALITNFGVHRLGAILIPTSPLLTPERLAHVIDDARPRVLVVSAMLLRPVMEALPDCRAVDQVVVFGGQPEELRRHGFLAMEDLLTAEPPELEPVRLPRTAVSVVFYSSGITEPPMGLAHLAEELLIVPDVYGRHAWQVGPDDVIAAAPLSYAGGYSTSATIPFRFGATSAVIPLAMTTPEGMFEEIRRHRVTLLTGIPSGYRQMLQVPGGRRDDDLATVRMFTTGGEPLAAATYHAWKERFGRGIHEGYGTNGMFYVFISSAVSRRVKPGSIGTALPGYEVKAIAESGEEARSNELGRLWARGPLGTTFWGPPERAEALERRQRATVRDGWIRIGDWVTVDEEGYVTFVARDEELITCGRHRFGPRLVEEALLRDPRVADAGAMGRPDSATGQRIAAYVVPGRDVTPGDVLRHRLVERCRTEVGRDVPVDLEFVSRVPRAAHGPLLRRLLWDSWFSETAAALR